MCVLVSERGGRARLGRWWLRPSDADEDGNHGQCENKTSGNEGDDLPVSANAAAAHVVVFVLFILVLVTFISISSIISSHESIVLVAVAFIAFIAFVESAGLSSTCVAV